MCDGEFVDGVNFLNYIMATFSRADFLEVAASELFSVGLSF